MKYIPSTFHPFPQLPPELRLKIWTFALPAPRIVEITWNSTARSLVSKSGTPAILHTCQESRHKIIKRYTEIHFGTCSQIILFNFDRDNLFFGPGCKHLVPSGRSEPWVMQNRKVIRDIKGSVSLQQNLLVVAFDCGFLLAMEDSERMRSLHEILDSMEKLTDVVTVKTVARLRNNQDGTVMPVQSDQWMDECSTRLET